LLFVIIHIVIVRIFSNEINHHENPKDEFTFDYDYYENNDMNPYEKILQTINQIEPDKNTNPIKNKEITDSSKKKSVSSPIPIPIHPQNSYYK